MIRARHYPDDTTLAIVEASTLHELQAATATWQYMVQEDPVWPVSTVVPAARVQHLLPCGSPPLPAELAP